ncbi:uncharacterized protein LOC110739536 [Chenopodium quinoa]|uniref:uncharacterized protein LOC110739536 n=1 Tax=Chenopodium quinoa TaxID=63459 RepID=UPI000B792BA7|nr:uncharacterized protein LOC110739536 [Chenopodium quinoa]XP_021775681.1 uncharacterized protein LOC110739536 [Chenopodium quinoa]
MTKVEKMLCNYVLDTGDSNEVFYHNGDFHVERHHVSSLLEGVVTKNIVDIWALILNQKDLGCGFASPKRFFCSATACAFFPVIHHGCYIVLCFNFKYSKVDVIDQRILTSKINEIYGGYLSILASFLSEFLKERKDPRANLVANFEPRVIRMIWKSNELDVVDSITMGHMETYMGHGNSWDTILKKPNDHILKTLRAKYCYDILKNEHNMVKEDVLKKAKLAN